MFRRSDKLEPGTIAKGPSRGQGQESLQQEPPLLFDRLFEITPAGIALTDDFSDWFADQVAHEWIELTGEAMTLLQREVELLEIVQLVGPDALAEAERAVLAVARMLREDFLQQSAYHEVDRFCTLEKGYWMLKAIMDFYTRTQSALEKKASLAQITGLPVVTDIARMKELEVKDAEKAIKTIMDRVRFSFAELGVE